MFDTKLKSCNLKLYWPLSIVLNNNNNNNNNKLSENHDEIKQKAQAKNTKITTERELRRFDKSREK